MADIHLDAGGSNTAPYDTWAKAATTFATACGASAAGDRVLMGSAYSESVGGINITLPGTVTAPVQLLSGTKGGTSGLTALVAGATITSSTTTYTLNGCYYAFGINFESGAGVGSLYQTFGAASGNNIVMDSCTNKYLGSGSGTQVLFGNISALVGSQTELRNHGFRLGHAVNTIAFGGTLILRGGAWLSGGTSPNSAFDFTALGPRGHNLLVEGFSFANCGAGINLVGAGQGGHVSEFRDITVPTSWSGAPIASGTVLEGQQVIVSNWKDSATWKRLWSRDRRRDVVEENTIVMAGGASDSAAYSWKMTTTANCAYPVTVARSPDMAVVNTVIGSSLTVTVEVIHDSVTNLTDKQIWLEVEEPDGTITTDAAADVLATAADQTTSSVTWTTTGIANVNKQKLVVTINASRAGVMLCRVCCAAVSKVVYIDPNPVVA